MFVRSLLACFRLSQAYLGFLLGLPEVLQLPSWFVGQVAALPAFRLVEVPPVDDKA